MIRGAPDRKSREAGKLSIPEVQVTRHEVGIPGLPASLHGATIVQVSDLHRGCGGTDGLIEAAVGHVNLMEPDYIFMTGDFVDGPKRDILPAVKIVSGLRARRGIFAVLGNHDHRGDPTLLLSALEAAGITVLNNVAREMEDGFWIAGIDDLREGKPDLPGTVRALPPGRPAILLSHEPAALDKVPLDLPLFILSGHTHGGQYAPTPWFAAFVCAFHLHTRYVAGWYGRGRSKLYVNRGIGVTGVPMMARRINCPSELTEFTLRQVPDGEITFRQLG